MKPHQIESDWEATYRAIAADLDLDPAADVATAVWLGSKGTSWDQGDPTQLWQGEPVDIVGPLPLERAPGPAAIGIEDCWDRHGLPGYPEVVVGDLDGDPAWVVEACNAGTLLFLAAHSDNREILEEWVPRLTGRWIPTTQVPAPGALLAAGFTDGDRAVWLARWAGAGDIHLLGFDWDAHDPERGDDPRKRKKLGWGKRLVARFAGVSHG